MSFNKRKNRQLRLTKTQTKYRTDYLGQSDNVDNFIEHVNYILKFHSTEDVFFNKAAAPIFKQLRHISKIAKELAEFLEQDPSEKGHDLMRDNIQRDALSKLVSALGAFYPQVRDDRNLQSDYQEDLPRKLRRIDWAITNAGLGIFVAQYSPLKKPRDLELDSFTSAVVYAFEINMGKLPVISEVNTDFQAIAIIFQAFDYDHQDALIKRVKRECKKVRRDRSSTGILGEESDP